MIFFIVTLIVSGQTKKYKNVLVRNQLQCTGALIDSVKIANDTLRIYYTTGSLAGVIKIHKNVEIGGYIKIGDNGGQIDSIKIVSDSLRFYIGGVSYPPNPTLTIKQ